MAYLFEPYNAYQKPPKKKHWMEIAEEEALLHRIQIEEQAQQKDLFHKALQQHLALREANAKQNQNPTSVNNQNVALPQWFPQPSSQQVQDGQYAAPAGGGGWALETLQEPTEQASFTALQATIIGPNRIFFTNTSPTPTNDTFFWDFGSGSLTSNVANPGSRLYTQTGSYTVTLQETSSAGNMTIASVTITVNAPTLLAFESLGDKNVVGPYTASITGTQVYNGSGVVTGFWYWGDGTASTPFTNSAGVIHKYETGSWTSSLALTESSYNITNVASFYISASIP